MATMKDIAKVAGVSTSTVSHVNNKTRFVSEKISERVNNAAKELNYY
ncbi:LacI family DNA-binding transcriptional regulator, partial [Vibrio parahaemolyticus]